jgi:hypothetical protein
MTLPTTYSWFLVGDERLLIPYEAPEGRRVNALGLHFTQGPLAGRFDFQTWASLPKSRARKRRKTPEEIAAAYGLSVQEVGPIDAARFLAFVWQSAGRPPDAPADWKRERMLVIALDNYSVHKGQVVEEAIPALEAANIFFFYLPSDCPEMSGIEPVWKDVKEHQMPTRSFEQVAQLKRAVNEALARKAALLRPEKDVSTNLQRLAA